MDTFKIYIRNNQIKVIAIFVSTLFVSYINYKLYNELNKLFAEITDEYWSLEINRVITILIFYLLLFVVSIIFNFIKVKLLQNGVSNLLGYFMKKIFYSGDIYTLNENASMVLSKATMSCNAIAKYYTSIMSIASAMIVIVVYAIIIFKIDASILILCIGSIPLVIVCTIGVRNKITYYQKKFFEHAKNRTKNVLEAFDNIKNIKAKNEYKLFTNRILDEQRGLEKNTTIYSFFYSYVDTVTNFIIGLAPIVILWFNQYITESRNIKNNEILILFIFIPLFLSSFATLHHLFIDYFECKPYLVTYQEICDLKEEHTGTLAIEVFNRLEAKNVFVPLENRESLKIPDMMIKKGEKILIIGESGIGKTTLFNILVGFVKNYEGILRINDTDLKKLDVTMLRDLIGVSFQNSQLFCMNLEDNISLGSDVDTEDIINLCRLNEVRIRNHFILNPNELSGGEKSRISLAQNLVRSPEVILIDESFAALDEQNEQLIIQEMLKKYKDKTIICISHKLELKKYFDRYISFN